MSIFEKLQVVVRYAAVSAEVSALGREPTENNCDIVDETGAPAFGGAEGALLDRLSVEFGSHDVAVLLARDRSAGLIILRIQVVEAADTAVAEGVS